MNATNIPKLFFENNRTVSGGSRIFRGGGRQLPRWITNLIFCNFFAENCMKMKEFGRRVGARVRDTPLDPPIRDYIFSAISKQDYFYHVFEI